MTNNEEEIFYSDEDISDSELDPVCLDFITSFDLQQKPYAKANIE